MRSITIFGAVAAAWMLAGQAQAEQYCMFEYGEYIGNTWVNDVRVFRDGGSVRINIDFTPPTCDWPLHLDHTISARVTFADGGWIYTGDIETGELAWASYATDFDLTADCANVEVETWSQCTL